MGKIQKLISDSFNAWAKKYHYRLLLFNAILISLFLLHSVGYFHPFFPISIDFIVLTGLILSVFMLGAGSKTFFVASAIFWIVAMFFKLLGIDVWVERTGVYVYQTLLVGVVLLLAECFKINFYFFRRKETSKLK